MALKYVRTFKEQTLHTLNEHREANSTDMEPIERGNQYGVLEQKQKIGIKISFVFFIKKGISSSVRIIEGYHCFVHAAKWYQKWSRGGSNLSQGGFQGGNCLYWSCGGTVNNIVGFLSKLINSLEWKWAHRWSKTTKSANKLRYGTDSDLKQGDGQYYSTLLWSI